MNMLTEQEQIKPAKALIVEDEAAYCDVQRYNLEAEGYEVAVAVDGEQAIAMAESENPDVIILDWMLPKLAGLEVCRYLRSRPSTRDIPLIMVTARAEESDRIIGLDTGADDYIVKSSSSMSELMARVRAVMRRTRKREPFDIVKIGDMEINRTSVSVTRAGKPLRLKPTEYRLLDHLASHPGKVFSRDQLLCAAWGNKIHVGERTVDVHVGRLRRALQCNGLPDPIRTVHSIGYALKTD